MAIQNVWVLDIVQELIKSGRLRSLARLGFIDRGRGAISIDVSSDGKCAAVYLSRAAWEKVGLDEAILAACLDTIDTYQPLSQAVVVAISPVGDEVEDRCEITTCLLRLGSDRP